MDEFNRPAVAFTLKPDAGLRFGAFTERHVNRVLATVLDDRVTSVATIVSRIDDRGQITGLSRDEVLEQVITFKSGALPADLGMSRNAPSERASAKRRSVRECWPPPAASRS